MQYVLITGANRGLGLALVQHYGTRDDTHIFAACRNPDQATALNQLATTTKARITPVRLDTTIPESIQSSLDAGILIPDPTASDFGHLQPEPIRHTLEVNAIAPLMIIQAYGDLLKAAGQSAVINISSDAGSMALSRGCGSIAYRMSKAALNMVTRCLSGTLTPYGVITIAIHPGWVQTDMGGTMAPLTPEESASGMVQIIDKLSPTDDGKFFDWKGDVMPW